MKKIFVLLIVLAGVLFTACTAKTTESVKPIIAVSIVPEQAFVEAISGDLVDVITVIPLGYSPENYEPTSATMEKISRAAVYFTIGVPTESGNILPNIQNVEIVSLEALVGEVYPDRTFSDGGRDPHIWLSITRVKEIVKIIRDKLQEIDPANAETYQSNAETFTSQLTDTDNTIRNIFSDVTMNTFIVYHPAFGYFADEYGLNMIAIEEEGKEATAIELQSIIDLARDDQIEYIFKQPEIDSSQVQSIADEINAEIITLNPLSADYCNNLISIANAIRDALR